MLGVCVSRPPFLQRKCNDNALLFPILQSFQFNRFTCDKVYCLMILLPKPDDLSVSEVSHFIYHPTLTSVIITKLLTT